MLSGLSLGLLFASAGLAAQNPFHHGAVAPKYRTHFVIYDVQKKATTTLFTIDGEWHAPNWTPDGKYIVSDMGGSLYRIPVSGANKGKPEKIYVSQKMMATNDHALSWDGKQIADHRYHAADAGEDSDSGGYSQFALHHEYGREQRARDSSGLAAWVVARWQVRGLHPVSSETTPTSTGSTRTEAANCG